MVGRKLAMRLMILCPSTKQPIYAGLEMERDTLDRLPNVSSAVDRCPACGKRHDWRPAEAWVEHEGHGGALSDAPTPRLPMRSASIGGI